MSNLDYFFRPKRVAVIGATEKEGSVGRTLMANLMGGGFLGDVIPINPKRTSVFNHPCFPSVKDVPDPIDLVVFVTPAKTIPDLIDEACAAKIPAGVIISAGFKELGEEGHKLEKEAMARAKKGGMRIIGPNCLGVMNPVYGLNATFAAGMAIPGNIAFLSQSGAMCTAVLDWSYKHRTGFSAFVSIGSMADIDWGDLITYFGNDPYTTSILIYMETIGDAKSFLNAARKVAEHKPIIVIKAGRTEAAAQAVASHTGSMAGSDAVFDAALKRVGVLRVDAIPHLFNLALILSSQPIPKGDRLTIVTNAGGPAVLATDAAVENGLHLAKLSSVAEKKLSAFLPDAWSHGNPVDILGDASPERYAKTIEIVARDPNTDGILVILTPQDMSDPKGAAEALRPYAQLKVKPILASWMGGGSVDSGIRILEEAGIPTFNYPDNACATFATMWQYHKNLSKLKESAIYRSCPITNLEKVHGILQQVHVEGREILTEYESKEVLLAYQIPTVITKIAKSAEEAVRAAKEIGFPTVIKLLSETITHKSDVGGVKLNLQNEEEVKEAYLDIEKRIAPKDFGGVTVQKMAKLTDSYELILGSHCDPQCGPVILFGAGGQFVEIFKDRALALPPLNPTLARQLMEETKIFHALKGARGRAPVDLDALSMLITSFSQLICDHPIIKECDINPLVVSSEGFIALDARIILHPPSLDVKDLPQPVIN